MRVLIVYASKHGQTSRIAEYIADVVRSAAAEPHVLEVSRVPRDIAPHAADVVIVAGSVYFGKYAKALECFVIAQRENLAKTRTAFVSVSGSARSEETRAIAEQNANAFLNRTGWKPDRVQLFAGGEPYTRYGFITRFVMKQINRKLGRIVDTRRDYDFTDWSAVSQFAREMVGKRAEVGKPEPALL